MQATRLNVPRITHPVSPGRGRRPRTRNLEIGLRPSPCRDSGSIAPRCPGMTACERDWLCRANQFDFVLETSPRRMFRHDMTCSETEISRSIPTASVYSGVTKEYSACNILKISNYHRVPPHRRGAYASSRYVEAGCGGREAADPTSSSSADGEVVWFCRPDAGDKSALALWRRAGDGGQKARCTEESTKEAVKTIAQGGPGCLAHLWFYRVLFVAPEPRVRSAPGLPCALAIEGEL